MLLSVDPLALPLTLDLTLAIITLAERILIFPFSPPPTLPVYISLSPQFNPSTKRPTTRAPWPKPKNRPLLSTRPHPPTTSSISDHSFSLYTLPVLSPMLPSLTILPLKKTPLPCNLPVLFSPLQLYPVPITMHFIRTGKPHLLTPPPTRPAINQHCIIPPDPGGGLLKEDHLS